MLEALFVLAFFGILYVDIIEILEKCDHSYTSAVQAVYLESQDTPRREYY